MQNNINNTPNLKSFLRRTDSTQDYPCHFIQDPILLRLILDEEAKIDVLESIIQEKRAYVKKLRNSENKNV